MLDNGLQKLYTINKKGTVCEWSASFRHEIKKNDRRLWERGGHFFLLLEIVHVICNSDDRRLRRMHGPTSAFKDMPIPLLSKTNSKNLETTS